MMCEPFPPLPNICVLEGSLLEWKTLSGPNSKTWLLGLLENIISCNWFFLLMDVSRLMNSLVALFSREQLTKSPVEYRFIKTWTQVFIQKMAGVRKVDLSWIVVYSNIWVEISGRIVGTISRQRSQTSSLINQRSRPTYANQMCFYPRLFVNVDRCFSAAPSYARTLSPLSLCLSVCLSSFRLI